MIEHDLSPCQPDYDGGSIVNLMSALGQRFGCPPSPLYPPLRLLPEARLNAAQRVALVVVDGLGAELLKHFSARKDGGSQLFQLSAGTMTSVYPPTTASAITTFMSGLAPQQHALTGWFMHFRKLGAVTAVLPFMPRYSARPLARAGIEPGQLIDAGSFAHAINVEAAALLPHELAESDYSRLLGAGSTRHAYQGLDDFTAQLARFCRGESSAEFLYAYWPEFDHLSHVHGPSSAPVASHFDALDAALAPLAEVADRHNTLLIITADHGFIDSGAAERIDLDDHPELAAMLTLPLCGEPRSAYAYVRNDCAEAFERYVHEVLPHAIELRPAAAMIKDGWFGRGEAHPELAARIGDYVLCMRERYTLRDRVVGERDFALKGVHGGLSRAEQLVPLLLAGS